MKLSVAAAPFSSCTRTRIHVSPLALGLGVKRIVRVLPEPPNTISAGATSDSFSVVTVTTSWSAGVSWSLT